MSTEKNRLSEMLSEDRILFFNGEESNAGRIEALARTFHALNPDRVISAVWHMEHRGTFPTIDGVRLFFGKMTEMGTTQAALGIAAQKISLMCIEPYESRFKTRAVTRALKHFFIDKKWIERLGGLRSAHEVLERVRSKEFATSS
jgi:hypothetical protein